MGTIRVLKKVKGARKWRAKQGGWEKLERGGNGAADRIGGG